MVLVDTSVWIRHLRLNDPRLAGLLEGAAVLTHPMVLGELSCGNPKNRKELFQLLRALPSVQVATNQEVVHLIEQRKLYNRGVGWVDMHLLASSLLADCFLMTHDGRLNDLAMEVGIRVPPPVTADQE